MSKAEWAAVARHRADLSIARGYEVTAEDALTDWIENHSHEWRRARHAHMLAMQREEILRHKWIESEKRNHDLGAEAVFDWIRQYAAAWRKWFDDQDHV
jgi:hypothetical protein